MRRARVWSFLVSWVGFALFWAQFTSFGGPYVGRLLAGALAGLVAVGVPFLLGGGIVRRLLERRHAASAELPEPSPAPAVPPSSTEG